MGQVDMHLVTIWMWGPIQIVSSPRGSFRTSQSRDPAGPSQADLPRVFGLAEDRNYRNYVLTCIRSFLL
jgi:hypothetical protein